VASVTEHALRKSVTAGAFEPAYYFYGADDFRKDEALAHMVASAVPAGTRDFNVEVRRGADLEAETLASLLGTPPMMAERRVLVIRDVGALRKDARRVLDAYLSRPASDAVVLLAAAAGAKPDRGLMDHATAVEFPALTEDRVPKWIAHRARELGVTVTPEATVLLAAATGNDLALLTGELDKLVSYVRGTPGRGDAGETVINESDVSAVVGVRRGETLGDLLDRIATRDAAGALEVLASVLALPKTTGVSVVMALTTQILAIAWGVARREQGTPIARLTGEYFGLLRDAGGGAFTGRPWGDAVATWVRVVDLWTLEELDQALDALLAADVALKDTRVSSDEQVLTSLLLALSARSAPYAKRARSAPPMTRSGAGVSPARVGRVVTAIGLFAAAAAATATVAWAQRATIDSAAADSSIARAQRLVGDGKTSAGRAVIDSVLAAVPQGSAMYAEALYARASLATSAADAEQDYRRITVEYPSSPRSEDALLRLAQMELSRGDREQAAAHLDRLALESSSHGPSEAPREYEIAQAFLELNDFAHGCSELTSAKSDAAPTDVELMTRVNYALQRCAHPPPAFAPTKPTPIPPVPPRAVASNDSAQAAHTAPAKPAAHATPPPPPQPRPVPSPPHPVHPVPPVPPVPPVTPAAPAAPAHSQPAHATEYTVQVAAYNLRAQAEALAAKLTAGGVEARVSGTAAPFRVRVGRYPTLAEADAQRKALKAKQIDGFVTAAEQ
jgi:DNA polymerase-3 subunit delta